MKLLLATLGLFACNNDDPQDSSPSDDTAELQVDVPYLVDDEETDSTSFETEAVEDAVQDALQVFLDLDAGPIIGAYQDLMDHAESGCPSWYTSEDGIPYWYDSCTTGEGASFEGYAYELDYDGVVDGNITWYGPAVGAVGAIIGPDGTTFEMNGTAIDWTGEIGDNEAYVQYSAMDGEFSYSGQLGGWLSNGLAPQFVRYIYDLYPSNARGIQVDGSVTGLDGSIDTVAFEGVYLLEEATTMSDCELEPSGVISVRTSDGDWFDLIFDVYVEGEVLVASEGQCDGCAAAWNGSQYLGEACADFSVWLD